MTTRGLAWAALVLQGLFVASWLIAGALEPGYDAARSFVSELAADGAEHPSIVTAGIVLHGAGFLALAAALIRALPAARVAAGLFAVAGVAAFVIAAAPLDCVATVDAACRERILDGDVSTAHAAHFWASLALRLAVLATPFALARALWSRPAGVAALLCGLAGVGIAVVVGALEWGWSSGAGYGQRLGMLVTFAWVATIAAGILVATRRPDPLPPLMPMRSQGFYTRGWTGSGEVVLHPRWFWKRFPMRFTLSRDIEEAGEDSVVFHDRTEFAGGFVHDQHRLCRMVAPDRVEVTAGDLPSGAVVRLEDDGYRIEPYRILNTVGPLGFVLTARDVHRPEGDGLRDTIELRWLGIPAATIDLHADPVDERASSVRRRDPVSA